MMTTDSVTVTKLEREVMLRILRSEYQYADDGTDEVFTFSVTSGDEENAPVATRRRRAGAIGSLVTKGLVATGWNDDHGDETCSLTDAGAAYLLQNLR